MKLLIKWSRLPPAERRLVIFLLPMLLTIHLGLKIFPVRVIAQFLERAAAPFPTSRRSPPLSRERLAWAVRVVAGRILVDGSCLAQALAARLLLRRYGYPASLHIGVAKPEGGRLKAHAWVESEGQVVIGGPETELDGYAPLPLAGGGLF